MTMIEITGVISTIVLAIAASLALVQILSIKKQQKDQYEWYRREKALSYSNLFHAELLKTKAILEESFDIVSRTDSIPLQEIRNKIENNKELRIHLNYLLTYYENVALACFNNIASEDVLFDLMANTLVSFQKKLTNYIDSRKTEAGNDRLWINFETIAGRWKGRLKKQKVTTRSKVG